MKVIHSISLVISLGILITACGQHKVYTTPPGYDLNHPQKYIKSDALIEISGIAFANNDSLFAIQDEEGLLFFGKVEDMKLQSVIFHKHGDYEDITILHNTVFILRSDGVIFSFPLANRVGNEVADVKEWKDIVPEGEYEGLFADSTSGKIYMLCKSCPVDKKKGTVTGYVFNWNKDSLQQTGNFFLNEKQIQQLSDDNQRIKPSALAINPITKEWYILSSVNKALIVADSNWQTKAVYPLKPSHYLQPEGIAFDSKGNLYISNEGDEDKHGNVLMIEKR